MLQAKISLKESQAQFLNEHKSLGFKNKSSLVRAALEYYREKLKNEHLKTSADLYAEIYTNDPELQDLTDSALDGWPE